MAYNETRMTVCGNVASRVIHHKVGSGVSRVNFRLFTTERRWDPDLRAWGDGNQMFLSVNCWRALADNAYASLNRGDPVVVTGRMMIKELKGDTGTRQWVEIEATAIGPNLALCTAEPVRQRAAPEAALADVALVPEVSWAPEVSRVPEAAQAADVAAPPDQVPANPVPDRPAADDQVPATPAGPTDAAGAAPAGRKRAAPARSTSKRAAPAPEPVPASAGSASTESVPTAPTDLEAVPAIVAPREEGESALVRPGEAEHPKEVAEVPF